MEDDLADMWRNFSLMEEENVGVSVGSDELEPLVSRGEACVVVKIQSDRVIPKDFFKTPLLRAWRPSGAVSFRVLGENLFLADFENVWDKTRILEGRPWLLDGNLISVVDFDGTTPPTQITFDKEAFWIRMYNLPLACMGKEVGQKIGASVGTVDDIDILDDEVGWGEYLRVRIVLDITKPLARGRMLHLEDKSIWIPFKYEKIPKFCYSCGVIKHCKTGCRNLGNRRSGGEAPFGSWLKVSLPGRRMGGAERYGRPKEPREREWRPTNEGSSSMGDSNSALKGDGVLKV
ncbi:uncharacterized protein LOC133879165 [Alnus glutinosa]|uniref:uncharacterized protein LOC133879165 n=1 Tax=Alnus glutinosa TaxID=3517 RepID=UPI002D78F46C|nr:uncharacterized protein LOC133879165 [Alnus glutinosa]